jgi:hypothetical protein
VTHDSISGCIAGLFEKLDNITHAIDRSTAATAVLNQNIEALMKDRLQANTVATEAISKASTKAKTKPAAPATATVAPQAATVGAVVDAIAPLPANAAPAPHTTVLEYQRDVAPTFARLLETQGPAAVIAIAKSYGAQRAKDIPPEHFVAALAAAKKALGE